MILFLLDIKYSRVGIKGHKIGAGVEIDISVAVVIVVGNAAVLIHDLTAVPSVVIIIKYLELYLSALGIVIRHAGGKGEGEGSVAVRLHSVILIR